MFYEGLEHVSFDVRDNLHAAPQMAQHNHSPQPAVPPSRSLPERADGHHVPRQTGKLPTGQLQRQSNTGNNVRLPTNNR